MGYFPPDLSGGRPVFLPLSSFSPFLAVNGPAPSTPVSSVCWGLFFSSNMSWACLGEAETSAEAAGGDGFGSCAVGSEGVPVLAPNLDPFRAFGPPATFSFASNNNHNHLRQNNNSVDLNLDTTGAAFAGGNLGFPSDATGGNGSHLIPQDLVAPLPDAFFPSQANVGPIFFPQSPDANPFSAVFTAPPPNLVNLDSGAGFIAFGTGSGASQMPEQNQGDIFRSIGGVLNQFGGGPGVCPAFAPPPPNHNLWINAAGSNLNPTPSSSSSITSSSAYAAANACDTRNYAALASPHSLPLPNSAPFAEPDTFASANLRRTRDYTDDDFLAALATGNFSSPSLPPHRSSPRQLSPLEHTSLPPQGHDGLTNTASMPRGPAIPVPRTAASERVRRASRSSVTSTVDLTSPKTERDSGSPAGVDPATPMAPPSTRKRSRAAAASNAQDSRSRRASASTRARPVKPARASRRQTTTANDDDLFNEGSSIHGIDDDDEVLDLTGANEVPAELLKPKVDNRVKLGKFQCVICMDDVSNLTVTHCGGFPRHHTFLAPLTSCFRPPLLFRMPTLLPSYRHHEEDVSRLQNQGRSEGQARRETEQELVLPSRIEAHDGEPQGQAACRAIAMVPTPDPEFPTILHHVVMAFCRIWGLYTT